MSRETPSPDPDARAAASRREFLRLGSMGAAALGLTPGLLADAVATVPQAEAPGGEVPAAARIVPNGEYVDVEVPDTLDLAARGALAVNVLTGNLEPENAYSNYQMFKPEAPEAPTRTREVMLWNITPKNLRALPWMRTMSGSRHAIDIEYGAMRTMSGAIDKGEARYAAFNADGSDAGTLSFPTVDALLLLAMDNWYQRDGHAAWKARIAAVAGGLWRSAIQVEDRAYYPLECARQADGTWRKMRQGGPIPYTPPEEPIYDQQGPEGSARFFQAAQIGALLRHHALSGDAASLDMTRRLARSALKPSMFVDTSAEGIAGDEHGIWEGHVHGNIYPFHMLLGLAQAGDDGHLARLVREAYHHGCRYGVMPMGWFPGWTHPPSSAEWGKRRQPNVHNIKTEGCAVSDMLVLAVKMTDAGLGDYWDDVDAIVRNQLSEQQYVSADLMRTCAGGGHQHDAVIARFVGGFGSARPTYNMWIAGCCTANCANGLYYAWHGITRFQDGVAMVNLFLNRGSTWMDVTSYLPYEGKVVLRNKQAHTAFVRVPRWLQGSSIAATVNGRTARPVRARNYLLFESLKPRDEITLTFPVKESVHAYAIAGVTHRLTLRGTTIVGVSPRQDTPRVYPIYQREHMKASKAPMVMVKRFIPARVLPLQ